MQLLGRLPLMVILAAIGSLAMLVPAGYASALGQGQLAHGFAMSAALLLVLVVITALADAASPRGHSVRGMLLTLLATYALLPVLLALPLWAALPDTGLLNAWWEMTSSLTTTGASLYDADLLEAPLHLWRGLVGWLGGLFTLVAAVAIMSTLR